MRVLAPALTLTLALIFAVDQVSEIVNSLITTTIDVPAVYPFLQSKVSRRAPHAPNALCILVDHAGCPVGCIAVTCMQVWKELSGSQAMTTLVLSQFLKRALDAGAGTRYVDRALTLARTACQAGGGRPSPATPV